MIRSVSTISIASSDIDKVKKTYTDVLGLDPPIRSTVYPNGRYREHSLMIGTVLLELLQPLEGTAGPGGGGMVRFLQRHGEGLYLVTVGLGDDPERYSKRLESKGVKVFWDVQGGGRVADGLEKPIRPRVAHPVHPLIHPRYTHGVLWELGRFFPDIVKEHARPSNVFRKVMAVSVVCHDNDQALKTYTETLELDPAVRSTVYEKGGYKEHMLAIGDIALLLQQPLVGADAPGRGGDMARALRQRGEGLYMVTVDVDDPVAYTKGLEAKGIRVDRFEPEMGRVVDGPSKPPFPAGTVHAMIDPAYTHGVLWEVGRFRPLYA